MLRLDLVQIVLVEIVTLLWCVLLSFLNLLFRSHVLFTKLLWDTKYWQILFSCPEVSMFYCVQHLKSLILALKEVVIFISNVNNEL